MIQIIQDKIDHFFSKYPKVTFSENEIIFRPGTPLTDIFHLQSGTVRMYSISADGEEVTLHIFRPTSMFPLMLLMTKKNNTYYFESSESSVAIKAPANSVVDFLKSEPDILYDVTCRFSEAISGLLTRIENQSVENSYHKIILLLLYLTDKFGEEFETGQKISIPITHEDIASWIGIRRETVSRQIEKLQKNGLVKVQKKHYVLPDVKKLKLFVTNQG